jgi:hypothetical protein
MQAVFVAFHREHWIPNPTERGMSFPAEVLIVTGTKLCQA